LSVDEAIRELRYLPYSDLGFARVDHHRELRLGLPEAVYGPGKTAEQAAAIVAVLLERNVGAVIVTRAAKSQFEAVAAVAPEAVFHEVPGLIVARSQQTSGGQPVAVVSAGTADLGVAEEAAVTAEALGLGVERLYDVGVAGLHRLLDARGVLDRAGIVIVVAGMDGALASVVGGLVAAPVRGGAHLRRLRGGGRGDRPPADDAQLVRAGRGGGQHRQRVRRCGLRGDDAEAEDAVIAYLDCFSRALRGT